MCVLCYASMVVGPVFALALNFTESMGRRASAKVESHASFTESQINLVLHIIFALLLNVYKSS
jgi:predicted membrane protein